MTREGGLDGSASRFLNIEDRTPRLSSLLPANRISVRRGDLVTADADHALRFEPREDGPRPYLHVRAGLDAVVARTVYYELAQRAIDGGDVPPGVWSAGAFFPLEPSA